MKSLGLSKNIATRFKSQIIDSNSQQPLVYNTTRPTAFKLHLEPQLPGKNGQPAFFRATFINFFETLIKIEFYQVLIIFNLSNIKKYS